MRGARRTWVRLARLARKPRTARWLLLLVPTVILILTVAGWRWARVEERRAILDVVDRQADRLEELVEERLELYSGTTVGIAERWRLRERATAEEWAYETATQRMVEPALDSLYWITPELEWRWSESASHTPQLTPRIIDALDASWRDMEPAVIGPLEVDGKPMVQVSVPVVRGGRFAGWVTAQYRLAGLARTVLGQLGSGFSVAFLHEGRELFERHSDGSDPAGGDPVRVGPAEARPGEASAASDDSPGRNPPGADSPGSDASRSDLAARESGEDLAREWGRERSLDLEAVSLGLRVWPTAATLERLRSPTPRVALVGGTLLALALTFLVGLIQVAADRGREAEMNARLQEEVRSRRRAERALERRAQELARSNREFEQFAYAVSHDLKDPLNALAMNLQMAISRQGDAEDMGRPLQAAQRSVERMNALLGGLLEYARAGGSGDPEIVDADEVLDDALDNLEESIRNSGATITRDELPRLVAHRTQLVRLLQNLVGNAVKFCDDADPRVHVSAERTSEGWHFQVRDNGIGLDHDEQERAFDLFWRPGGSPDGSGVGLAVCKRIAEAHGGRIWLESAPGEGSTFHFILGYEPTIGSP